jgi:hypothetical protein
MKVAWKLAPKEIRENEVEHFGYEPTELDKIWRMRELWLEVYPDGLCDHDYEVWGHINMNIEHIKKVLKSVDIIVPQFLYLDI